MATTGVLSSGLLFIDGLQPGGGAHGRHRAHHGHHGPNTGGPTLPSTLPAVRCATCGRELALDQLTAHTCLPNTTSLSLPPSPPNLPVPVPAPAPAPAPTSPLDSPSPGPPVMMAHPRTLMPGDPRSMMTRSPSPLRPQQVQFIEQNQRLPPRIIPNQQRAQQLPPWEPPMQQQHQPILQRQAPLPPVSPPRKLDTKTGGEAGMAGVGRRGFAMVAAAAMFSTSAAHAHKSHTPIPIDPARRFNVPQHPDTNSANPGDRGVCSSSLFPLVSLLRYITCLATPRLSSPNSSSYSPTSPRRAAFPNPRAPSDAFSNNTPPLATSKSREVAPNSRDPKPEPLDMGAAATGRFPFNDRLKHSSPVNKTPRNELLSPTGTQASENELSYLRGSIADAHPPKPASIQRGTADAMNNDVKVRFPSTKDRRAGNASTSSSYSSSSGPTARSVTGLERSLSTPFESPSSSSYTQTSSKDTHADHPTRSNTSPSLGGGHSSQGHPTTRRRSEKTCIKCGKRITDGKWILVDQEASDGGKVLCEYDWKMLYLPKCRRCDRPIEGQAIGSSDGQIKGKYHRDCFNCTTCQVRPSFLTNLFSAGTSRSQS
jgi:hypothetical protein